MYTGTCVYYTFSRHKNIRSQILDKQILETEKTPSEREKSVRRQYSEKCKKKRKEKKVDEIHR